MVLSLALALTTAHAGPEATRDAMDRLQEVLEARVEDERLVKEELLPTLLVSTQPQWEESQAWFGTRALEVLIATFGDEGLRLCEACMAPRTVAENGTLVVQTGPIGIDEVVRLDEQHRGTSAPARTAIWLDESRGGVSIRIVDLKTAGVLFAMNVDPLLVEQTNTKRRYRLAQELERRADGKSLTQAFVDASFFPNQHISLDWTDQWGKRNHQLSGITVSVLDPFLGIGAVHYTRTPLANTLIGGKLILSGPRALLRAVTPDAETGPDDGLIDPLITGVAVVRVPIGRSNYGIFLSASTNARFGIGISLMNISLLPVIP